MVILIADDDRLIRFSLKSMLLDIVSGNTKIIEAKNGQEMVEQCAQNHPEIVFADINMPRQDGISAIAQCRKLSPATQFVVLTAYSDFNYAKKCISLQVSDYILKPIDCEQLNELMKRLVKNLTDTQETRNSKFQVDLIDLFQLWDEAGAKENEQYEEKSDYYGFVFFIDCANRSELYAKTYRNLLANVKVLGSEFIHKKLFYAILNSKEGVLRTIFKDEGDNFHWILLRISQICANLSKDCLVSCFYVRKPDLYSLYLGCEQIEHRQYLRFLYPPCKALALPETEEEKSVVIFLKRVSDLLLAFQDVNQIRYRHAVNDLQHMVPATLKKINLDYISQHICAVIGAKVSSKDLKSFCSSLLEIQALMYRQANVHPSGKIDQIKEYISQNYMDDISINMIAEKFDLTPNYLSKHFHEKSGVKFIDYLTNVRIANAKRILIQNSQVSIKDVAIMVGYHSPRHFASIFQKSTGDYPSEFRKNYQRNSGEDGGKEEGK